MPTPAFPTGFKPVVQGYSIGAPDGVAMTEVGGGLPRVGLEWDRGRQAFQVTMTISEWKFNVWTVFFHHIIKGGSIQFTMPINSGMGLASHLCVMVPGSYQAVPAGSSRTWYVSFTVLAESQAFQMTHDEAVEVIDLWEAYGEGIDGLLAQLEQLANVDILVVAP